MQILFMCVANSARSQLAEGLAKSIFPGAEIQSAGSHPGNLNPFAVVVMKEQGLDISKNYAKSVDELSPQFKADLDYIITLCAEEVCPTMIAPRAKRLHWTIRDPASKEVLPEDEMLRRFREARDLIRLHLEQFRTEQGQ